ncbi:MAG: transcription elongation factor GreA, partial [Clostridia bacterium]|nr:transcription elongation factor GreA [Clostridia bacterium]
MAELFITEEGKKEIQERLKFLKNEKRPEVLEKLKV